MRARRGGWRLAVGCEKKNFTTNLPRTEKEFIKKFLTANRLDTGANWPVLALPQAHHR